MKILNLVGVGLTSFSLATFAGSFLFGAGSLTVLGWVVMLPMFLGGTLGLATVIIAVIPEGKSKEVPASEAQGVKPTAQTA